MEKFLKQWTEKTIRKGILFTALGLLWIFVVGSAANVGYDILHPETVKWEKKGGSNGDGSESEEEIFFKDVDPVKYAAKKGWDFFLASSVTGNRLYELGWFLVWVGDLVYIGEYLEEDYGLISLLVVVSCLLYLTTYGPWGWLGALRRHGLDAICRYAIHPGGEGAEINIGV